MPTYETVFAIPSSVSDEERSQKIKGIEEFISGIGGAVKLSEEMGEKQLAYKVKGHDRAYYHLVKFSCPPDGIDKLKKHYSINSEYIRNIVVVDRN